MSKKHIESAWQSYREMVIPPNAPAIQVSETRQAFYAGAATLFQVLITAFEGGDEPTENDMQIMNDLTEELAAYGQEIDANVLGIRRH